jgi:FkbH-like protein
LLILWRETLINHQKDKVLLISDFNISNLASLMSNDDSTPMVHAGIAPFGQITQALISTDLKYWQDNPDYVVLWTQPEGVINTFHHILNYEKVTTNEILKEVDEYSSLILAACHRVKALFVPAWVTPLYNRGLGMLDMKTDTGISNMIMRMNLRLSENLCKAPNVYLLNTQRWVMKIGEKSFNPKLWYMGKIPFGNQVFIEALHDIKAAIRGLTGHSKKLILLDLDDTLWGGIVGDLGWENIRLGGHDHIGEAFVDFQRAIKSLKNRGILLGIVSKNEESVAMEAIEKHPEMILNLKDFVVWRINWQDKAQNIVEILSELRLGPQSVVFIDDNPVERDRIRTTLTEVYVPEWPNDKMLYASTLLRLNCFDSPSISKEDLARTSMYANERHREQLKKEIGSLDEWLKNLRINIQVEGLNTKNLSRTVQLLNKTNQMNLTTRRMTEKKLNEWVHQGKHRLWTFRVCDKFGDSGLTGIISLEEENQTGRIVDFVLSCRVMGRKVEEVMLHTIIQYAQSAGLKKVVAKYIQTAKNKPCLNFFKLSGFDQEENNLFTRDTDKTYEIPEYIRIEVNTEAINV